MAKASNTRPKPFPETNVFTDSKFRPDRGSREVEFDVVSPDELAFALCFFVSAANGRIVSTGGPSKSTGFTVDYASKPAALLAQLLHDSQGVSEPLRRGSERSLEATLLALWSHYDGHESQVSICTRILGFYRLTLRNAGTYLEEWITPCAENPEAVELHPAVVEALAAIPLSESGSFLPETFLTFVATVARTHAL